MSPSTAPRRPVLRRTLAAASAIAVAAVVVTGCGSDSSTSGSSDDTTAASKNGALGWLPDTTWLVANVNAETKTVDRAITTLDRLPAWSLAESFLPAKDATGLRRELLKSAAASSDGDVTAKQLEAAFGEHGGLAITDNDFDDFGDNSKDNAPVAGWIEVDDPSAAEDVMAKLADTAPEKSDHRGVDVHTAKLDGQLLTWIVEDDLLLVTSNPARMDELIDAHAGADGTRSVDDSEDARRVLEAGVGDALVGVAIATDPLIDAGVVAAHDSTDLPKADQDRLARVIASKAVDGVVPDWIGGSMTIDDVGLRWKGSWSNPRDIADADMDPRELAERAPADAPIVAAGVSDGSTIERVQSVWKAVHDEADVSVDDIPATGQLATPAGKPVHDLLVESLRTLLEDEKLAEAAKDAGPMSAVATQDLAAALGPLAAAATPQDGAGRAAPRAPKLTKRVYEFGVSRNTDAEVEYTPPAALRSAAAKAGLSVASTMSGDAPSVTIKVAPRSPLGALIRTQTTAADRAGLTSVGIDIDQVLTPAGLTLTGQTVDGIVVGGFPANLPSTLAKALGGDIDTLGKSTDYRDAVDAAKPPEDLGQYAWFDLAGVADSVLGAFGAGNPAASSIGPTVRNNLEPIPGVLAWSTRREVDGEDVGVVEAVAPIRAD